MKQATRKTQTVPALDIVVVWRILKYEADMFITLRKRRLAGSAETYLQFALIEAELIHVRVLCGFLLDLKTHPTDVSLADMITGKRAAPLVDSIKKLCDEYGRKTDQTRLHWQINKFVAHFTRERKTAAQYGQLLADVEPKLATVLENVAGDSQCPWPNGSAVLLPMFAKDTGSTNAFP